MAAFPMDLFAGIGRFGLDATSMFLNQMNVKDAADRAEEMYKHRYQWAVRDLKKANLNPLLAIGGGLSGGGAPTSFPYAQMDLGGALESGIATAKDVGRYKDEMDILRSQKESAREGAHEAGARASQATTDAAIARDFARKQVEQALAANAADIDNKRAQTRIANAEAALAEADAAFYSTEFGRNLRSFERSISSVQGVTRFLPFVGEAAKVLSGKGPEVRRGETIHKHYRMGGRP